MADAKNLVRSLGEQMLGSMQAPLARGDRQILIRLQPPELGAVLVRCREQGEHIDGLIEVGNSEIRQEIEQALPQVLRSLQEAGVPIRRFEVTVADSSEKDLVKGQLQQEASPQQHRSDRSHDHVPPASIPWLGTGTDCAGACEQMPNGDGRSGLAPGRLDMLL